MATARRKRSAPAPGPAGRAAKAPAKAAKGQAKAPRSGARERGGPSRRPAGARRGAAAPPLPVPDCLVAATEEPAVVDVPARAAVSIDGAGPPDDPAFGRSLGALYGAAYGLKFARKASGATFRIGPLEGRWWAEGAPEGLGAPRETWRWRLRIGVPDDVTEGELARVVSAAVAREGGKLEGSEEARRVRVERIAAARLGRILHVGPYSEEPRSFERLDAAVAAAGLRPAPSHLEIYLSDPRRTAPARLRTVLLRELTP
jgi:hypothetical protein